jgi:hypothetical protein
MIHYALRDSNMIHYDSNMIHYNLISNVPSFKLGHMKQALSYSVVPVDCILNGAVLLPGPPPKIGTVPQPDTCYWALLSPREHESYKLSFQ